MNRRPTEGRESQVPGPGENVEEAGEEFFVVCFVGGTVAVVVVFEGSEDGLEGHGCCVYTMDNNED